MSDSHLGVDLLHLSWICPGSLDQALDKATWLEVASSLRQWSWSVDLIVVGPKERESIDRIRVHCIPRPDIYLLRQIVFHFRVLIYLLRNWSSIDIILFHQMSALWIMPLKFVRIILRKQKPLFVMDTRTAPMQARPTVRDRIRRIYDNLMNWTANYWADGQTTITLRMALAMRIPQGKLWGIWPSGVSVEKFVSAQSTRCWPAGEQAIRLVYVGDLGYERNLITLCRAAERANAQGMNFAFSIVGDGTARTMLEDYSLRSRGMVCVIRPVPHDEIPRILAQAHLGVLPFPDEAKFQVSSPIKLFEYMAAGLPILATHISCHTDVIGGGQYVFWAQDSSLDSLTEALCRVWQARSSLEEMGRKAVAAAQGWTWRASAYKLKTALEYGLSLDQGKSKAATR